jgi:hypothetical protein
MDFLWAYYQQGQFSAATSTSEKALTHVEQVEDRIFRLERTIDQLKLVNIAFAELLVQNLGIPQSELIDKVKEIDLRDGVQNGRISTGVLLCPKCHRRYNAKVNKCQYCGYVDLENQTIFDKLI